jgi:hypothetical protein
MKRNHAIGTPIVILGAARSGTSMLRDLISSHNSVSKVPYDINYVWKYGNYSVPHDELTPDLLDEKKRSYIRAFLNRFRGSREYIVEKTACNTLRVEFVLKALPEARVIHIIRDGRDVAVSARKMWCSGFDLRRLRKKIGQVPFSAVYPYGLEYLKSYCARIFSNDGHVSTWGPHFKKLEESLNQYSLIEVCGIQWRESLNRTLESLDRLPSNQYCTVRYEDLLSEPEISSTGIFDFLHLEMSSEIGQYLKQINHRNIGKWRNQLTDEEYELLLHHIEDTLKSVGY